MPLKNWIISPPRKRRVDPDALYKEKAAEKAAKPHIVRSYAESDRLRKAEFPSKSKQRPY